MKEKKKAVIMNKQIRTAVVRRDVTDSLNETEVNFFTGMFDFSDDKQSSSLLGLQHQNEELFRNSFLGKLSPITGGFLQKKVHFTFIAEYRQNMNLDF